MNGTDIVVDTNICIYLLNGDRALAELLQDQNLAISVITEIELYAYHSSNAASIKILDTFLETVPVISIDEKVKSKVIALRKTTKLKLPDCLIAASALAYNLPLMTADKAFRKIEDLDLIIYDNIQ